MTCFYHRNIAVIGSDIIGAGIAHVSIDKDLHVILRDATSNAISCGKLQIIQGYENSIQRNRMTR